MIDELSNGKIAGVGLDVYDNEGEYFLKDLSNSYKRDKKFIITNFNAKCYNNITSSFFTNEALNKIASDTCHNIKDIFTDGKCNNELV